MRTQSERNQPLAVVLALVLASCSQPMQQEDSGPEWETLADGSHLLVTEETDFRSIERCFPTEDDFQCLVAVDISPKSSWLVVTNETRRSPNKQRERPIGEGVVTGYGCQIMIFDRNLRKYTVTETLSSKHGALRENTIHSEHPYNQAPFSRQEVEDYLRANAIEPHGLWLNCYRVAQLVVEGSIASLTSSDLTLETFAVD